MKAKIFKKGTAVIINLARGPQGSVLKSKMFMYKGELSAWVEGFRRSPVRLRLMEVA